MQRLRAVDLFCGCGGFSLGAHAAGFEVVCAYDIDPILTSSFETNFPKTKLHIKDISSLIGDEILTDAGGGIDLLFGGPPCQGFSSIGRRRKDDVRRTLVGHFFRLVAEAEPRAFVMENVQGLAYRDALPELEEAIRLLPPNYRTLGPLVLNASEFGAATKRKRIFVVGYDSNRCAPVAAEDIEAAKSAAATVADALSGLDAATKLASDDRFDRWQIPAELPLSHYAAKLVGIDRVFTGNQTTQHTTVVRERFSKIPPGAVDAVGKHPRLSWVGQCPTLRAGTGSDVGSFQSVRPIHPDKHRVITVREAARLQGFPDHHVFHPTIWHSFRMIGNSVSPIIAEAVLAVIAEKLEVAKESKKAA